MMFAVRSVWQSVSGRTSRWTVVCVMIVATASATSGCASRQLVRLRERPHNPLAGQLKLYAQGGPRPSDRTRHLLQDLGLPDSCRGDVRGLILTLQQKSHSLPGRELDLLHALAELNYIAARRIEHRSAADATSLYLASIARSYEYLFDPRRETARERAGQELGDAVALYNTALEDCLRLARAEGNFRPGHVLRLNSAGADFQVSIVPRGEDWQADDFDHFEFVSDYELTGLRNHHRTEGLGVPLIAVRKGQEPRVGQEQYYAPNLSFPVTAFLRMEWREDGRGFAAHSQLELHDPLETATVGVAGHDVPLQSDISTPLAHFLSKPGTRNLDTFGLLRPDKARQIAGLYMLQPYQPDKIPVLMVHGLWSSPMTWMETFNDLRSDPQLRDRYQFWFYLYPTGVPFWETAADLRERLAQVQDVFGREQSAPVLDDMVLVGHSMGGLISRMMVVNSGDRFWNQIASKPLDQIEATPEMKEEIQRVFFFERQPSVGRVVTIATPHRGSDYSNGLTRWLGRQIISLPGRTVKVTHAILTANPGTFRTNGQAGPSTSVDSLSPESPILQVLAETPNPDSVKHHNVVGVSHPPSRLLGRFSDVRREQSDGVVGYSSAHLERVESEIEVSAPHSGVQAHPDTIAELRRILFLHLEEIDRRPPSGVIHIDHATAGKNSGSRKSEAAFPRMRRDAGRIVLPAVEPGETRNRQWQQPVRAENFTVAP